MTKVTRLIIGLFSAHLGLLGCFAGGGPAHALGAKAGPPKDSKALKSKVASVTIFKNGRGYFVREARVAGAGWVHSEPPPGA